jgi:hypothetical protein
MFPGRGESVDPVKALCAGCPVVAECATDVQAATVAGR